MPTLNEILLDRAVRHSVYLERLKTHEVNEILKFLNNNVLPDISDDIVSRLAKIEASGFDLGPQTTKRLKSLYTGINEQIRAGMKYASDATKKQLPQIGMSEAEWQAALIKQSAPVALDFTLPSMSQIRSILTARPMEGRFLSDWWDGLSRRTQTKIRQQLQTGLVRGEPMRNLIRRVEGVYGGLRRDVTAIVRTAVNHTATNAREMLYEENSDVIKEVIYIATLDERTTMICASLDGQTFPINEGERPPMHFNCRSTTAPVVKSWRALGLKEPEPGTRASMNGYVPEKLTYNKWLKKQPASVQDEVLGPTRGKLFRKEKLSVDKFTDSSYNKLTLKELRTKEGLPV